MGYRVNLCSSKFWICYQWVYFCVVDLDLTLIDFLGGSPIAHNRVTNAFMLTFGSTLMAAGALADSYGRKRIFLCGLAAFILFSGGLAFSPDIVWFDSENWSSFMPITMPSACFCGC